MYPSPGPYAPFPPPGLGAPAGLPPPATLGFAVGRLLGVVLDVVVAFVFVLLPEELGEVPLPAPPLLELPPPPPPPVGVAWMVMRLVMTWLVVCRFESSPMLVLRLVDTDGLLLYRWQKKKKIC